MEDEYHFKLLPIVFQKYFMSNIPNMKDCFEWISQRFLNKNKNFVEIEPQTIFNFKIFLCQTLLKKAVWKPLFRVSKE
jgi:hypothetical protein